MVESVTAARLTRVVEVLDGPSGVRCCEHTVAAHARGEFLAICGFHPDVGLMCEPCSLRHGETAHRDMSCDFCRFPFGDGEPLYVRPRVLLGAYRVRPPGVRSGDDDPLLLAPAGVAALIVVRCGEPACETLADWEADAVDAAAS